MKDEFTGGRYTYAGLDKKLLGTSVPLWDAKCGEIIYEIEELEPAINKLVSKFYEPRKIIIEKMSIEKCFQNLIDFVEKL